MKSTSYAVRLLPLWAGMTTSRSMESTITRRILFAGVVLLAATMAACGGSTQAMTGTTPSQVSSIAAMSENGGNFSLLKEGQGRGHSPAPEIGTPTTGTTPDPDDPEADDDAGESGHGHGKALIQYEGFTKSISENCPALTILFDDDGTTIKTDAHTDFQRAECAALKQASETSSIHLHIAAKKLDDGSVVATYVRMQGPKFDVDDPVEEEDTTN